MRVAEQEVFHDDAHPAAIVVPIAQIPQWNSRA
jgi:hypothetical protein